ncbi:MAG: signal peptidase II [Bacilli bacterium]|nr:signal peptidase II [Bacilli bacterium]
MKEKLLNGLKWLFKSYIWLGVLLLAIDIITKQIIMHSGVTPPGIVAKWGFVNITYVLNTKAAFGIGADNPDVSRTIYLIVATLISAGLITYLILKRKDMKLFIRAALIMVVTGAIGNMIDRIFYGGLQGGRALFGGAVVDWIDFYWIPGWVWNFNIADSCIVVAAFMLIIYIIVIEVKDYREKNKNKVKTVNDHQKVLSKSEKEKLEAEKAEQEESK